MQVPYNKIIVIHPGTQHAYRFANALAPLKTVLLISWFTLSPKHFLAGFSIFRKRIKPISKEVKILNFPIFEIFLFINIWCRKIFNTKNNNPYYFWQSVFGWFLLPILYLNRKHSILVIFETCGWPITKYAKKWNIPVIMDFASISHESAQNLGISESNYGIKVKTQERQYIDFALNCSSFALNTYKNKTSAKKHFAIWLGTDFKSDNINIKTNSKDKLHICCLANTEQRKGIDILIESFNRIEISNKKLYLIGKINSNWVTNYCQQNNLSSKNIILTGPKAQQDLKQLLINQEIDLHILPSRFDSFGMAVPETMALGIPNIVSPYVGAGEMITDRVDGYLMDTLDANALSKCIKKYLALTDLDKNKLQQNAINKSKKMTWENYNQRIRDTLDEIFMLINNR